MPIWKTISSKVLLKHPRLTVIEDTVELPDGTQVPYLKYGALTDSVTIICVMGDKVLLQQEYSYPPNQVLYQFPGGKVDKNELPEDAAMRELVEESGVESASWQELGWYFPNNRRSDAKMFVYLADKIQTTSRVGGDHEEDIISTWFSVSEVETMISNGTIRNFTLLAAWSLYRSQKS